MPPLSSRERNAHSSAMKPTVASYVYDRKGKVLKKMTGTNKPKVFFDNDYFCVHLDIDPDNAPDEIYQNQEVQLNVSIHSGNATMPLVYQFQTTDYDDACYFQRVERSRFDSFDEKLIKVSPAIHPNNSIILMSRLPFFEDEKKVLTHDDVSSGSEKYKYPSFSFGGVLYRGFAQFIKLESGHVNEVTDDFISGVIKSSDSFIWEEIKAHCDWNNATAMIPIYLNNKRSLVVCCLDKKEKQSWRVKKCLSEDNKPLVGRKFVCESIGQCEPDFNSYYTSIIDEKINKINEELNISGLKFEVVFCNDHSHYNLEVAIGKKNHLVLENLNIYQCEKQDFPLNLLYESIFHKEDFLLRVQEKSSKNLNTFCFRLNEAQYACQELSGRYPSARPQLCSPFVDWNILGSNNRGSLKRLFNYQSVPQQSFSRFFRTSHSASCNALMPVRLFECDIDKYILCRLIKVYKNGYAFQQDVCIKSSNVRIKSGSSKSIDDIPLWEQGSNGDMTYIGTVGNDSLGSSIYARQDIAHNPTLRGNQ